MIAHGPWSLQPSCFPRPLPWLQNILASASSSPRRSLRQWDLSEAALPTLNTSGLSAKEFPWRRNSPAWHTLYPRAAGDPSGRDDNREWRRPNCLTPASRAAGWPLPREAPLASKRRGPAVRPKTTPASLHPCTWFWEEILAPSAHSPGRILA